MRSATSTASATGRNRPDNRNVERERVADWLKRQGHSDKTIDKALFELNKAAGLGGSKTLYDANREVYGLLRYGVKVRPDVGEQNVTVWLIDWENPSNNDFAIAEEVTVRGENTKRPDLVLYVNGVALGGAGTEALDSVSDRRVFARISIARRRNSSSHFSPLCNS